MAKKPIAPQIAFFIVNHGIPTVSIGFSNEQSVLFGGILTAISSLTSSETSMGMLDDIQAEKGRIFIQNVGHDSLVGFFIWHKARFAQKIEGQLKVLTGILGTRYLADYLSNPAFEEILLVEGIDGIIKEDKLGLDVIFIQAKKWENTVGRPEIQKFVGALEGKRAKKGIFITTSSFSREALNYISNINKKIVLIDGVQLAEYMIDYNIGVSSIDSYEVKKIDSDYFEED